MEFIRSHMARVFVAVFVVLFCGELLYKVKGVAVVQLVNIGDNITLNCYPPRNDYNYKHNWYRNVSFLANSNRNISINYPRITQAYIHVYTDSSSLYSLSIYYANIADSAIYKCFDYIGGASSLIQSYDVRVIGCSCTMTNHTLPENEKVICDLENFKAERQIQLEITINGDINKTILIAESTFSFAILRHELYNSLQFELNPYTDAMSSIRCRLPAQLTSPSPSTHYPTTSLILTAQNGRSKASHTTSQELISGEPISTAVRHTTQNKNSNLDKNLGDGDITMIIAIAGSVFILILIFLIVVLRCKQMKDRKENKHNGNVSVDDKVTKEHPEACYESVEDASQRGPQYATSIKKMRETSGDQQGSEHLDNGGLIDNILYDSSDKIVDSLISRTEGPLDNALYAMPDRKGTLNRESRSEVIDGSSNADILYGNSVIISQQEQKRDTLQRGDQYENVRMPGSGAGGDAEEIPLYAMPDKGPKRNTLKATPKAEQTSNLSKDEVVDVDELYAEVDKTKKK